MTRKVDPVIVLRRLRRELEDGIALLEAHPKRDERAQGQLEALRHIKTVIQNEARTT